MFRSTRRDVVFPQAEHARLAGAIAAAWGNERFERPCIPFSTFVEGVALHDRGYGELDEDGIGDVAAERWVEIQRRSFAPRNEDPVVDLVVALHVHRLVSKPRNRAEQVALPEMESALPLLRAAAGVDEPTAAAADSITRVCDRASFDICLEEPAAWTVSVVPAAGRDAVDLAFTYDGERRATLTPWPLGVSWLAPLLTGFRADGYPRTLEPVLVPLRIEPSA